jgi:hypothetical protein
LTWATSESEIASGGAWASGILDGEMRRLAAALDWELSAVSSAPGLGRGSGTFLASDLPDLAPCLSDFLSSECVDFLPAVFELWLVDAFSAAAT